MICLFLIVCFTFTLTNAEDIVTILSPTSLRQYFDEKYKSMNGNMDSRMAFFGTPNYDEELVARIVYGVGGNTLGCEPFNRTDSHSWPPRSPDQPYTEKVVLLIDRGECTFVTKVANAERAGALAVIVVDNCVDCNNSPLPFMADDLTQEVRIPSILIHNDDGNTIKQAIASDNRVEVSMTWKLSEENGEVVWQIWADAHWFKESALVADLEPIVGYLGPKSDFVFNPLISSVYEVGCGDPSVNCDNRCLNDTYCAYSQETDVTGVDIVRETLFQHCVYELANQTGMHGLFFAFIKEWRDTCAQNPKTFHGECSEKLIAKLHPEHEILDTCLTDKLEYQTLYSFLRERYEEGALLNPTIQVNPQMFKGSKSCDPLENGAGCELLNLVCKAFKDGERPCGCSLNWRDGCVPGGGGETVVATEGGISVGTLVVIIFLLLGVIGIFVYGYTQRQRAQMTAAVDQLLSKHLSENGAANTAHSAALLENQYEDEEEGVFDDDQN